MNARDLAIQMASEYKAIEIQFPYGPGANRRVQDQLRARVAEIAAKMYDLGYPLTPLLQRRQEHDRIN